MRDKEAQADGSCNTIIKRTAMALVRLAIYMLNFNLKETNYHLSAQTLLTCIAIFTLIQIVFWLRFYYFQLEMQYSKVYTAFSHLYALANFIAIGIGIECSYKPDSLIVPSHFYFALQIGNVFNLLISTISVYKVYSWGIMAGVESLGQVFESTGFACGYLMVGIWLGNILDVICFDGLQSMVLFYVGNGCILTLCILWMGASSSSNYKQSYFLI